MTATSTSYAIPAEGGEPTRLTWHPGDDIVRGFTPDGKVLFSSPRAAFSRRLTQFFTIGIDGGVPRTLPVPTADMGAISPDGKYLAYTPLGERFRQWKNYRGGTASRIWVLKLGDLSHEEIPKPTDGCNDTEPMWIADTVYFLSDRDGEFNLYSYDRDSKKVCRRTEHEAFPVASASAGAGQVIYEQAGWIHFTSRARASRDGSRSAWPPTWLRPGPAMPRPEVHPQRRYLPQRQAGRARVSRRDRDGPRQEGRPRNLTRRPVHTSVRRPGRRTANRSRIFLTRPANTPLMVRPQDGKGEARSYPLKRAGFYERPVWSPDSKKIAFIDNARAFYWIDLATG